MRWCHRETAQGLVQQGDCVGASATGRLWRGSCDRETVQGSCNRETVQGLVQQVDLCCNKYLLLKRFCRDKHTFVATKDVFCPSICYKPESCMVNAGPILCLL